MRDAAHLLALAELACLCAHGLLRAAEAEAVAGRAEAEAMRAVEAATLAAERGEWDVAQECDCSWWLRESPGSAGLRDTMAVECPRCWVRVRESPQFARWTP